MMSRGGYFGHALDMEGTAWKNEQELIRRYRREGV